MSGMDDRHPFTGLRAFCKSPDATWGGDLSQIDFDDIYYYVRATDGQGPIGMNP
jgi:Fe-S cluster assembly scaffold protein SufB